MEKIINNKLHLAHKYSDIAKYYREKDYNRVIKVATEYLKNDPNNVNVRFMRAKSYRVLEMFNEAINDLEYGVKRFNNKHSITELYYLYYFLNEYDKALELLPTLYKIDTINKYSLAISELVMKTSMGINIKFREDRDDYIKRQIRNYNKDDALYHIKIHSNVERDKSVFDSKINIEYLFDVVSQNILNNNKKNVEEILEIHCFLVPNVGYYGLNKCNYIKVIVIPNTNKVLNMYPVYTSRFNDDSILECDFDKLFNRKDKIKNLSQIDKFNQRYKR